MSLNSKFIQQRAALHVQGYSPALDAGTADKTGLAKAGQVVKNITGKVSARLTRFMIRASGGEKVDNASIVEKIKGLKPQSNPDTNDLHKLRHSLQSVQIQRAAWRELQQRLGKDDENAGIDPFAAREVEIQTLIKSEIESRFKKLVEAIPKLSKNLESEVDSVTTTCENIQAQLRQTDDLKKRADIIKSGLGPFNKIKAEYYDLNHKIIELKQEKERNGLTKQQENALESLEVHFAKANNIFLDIEKLEADNNSSLVKLQDELAYTEILIQMKNDFTDCVAFSETMPPPPPPLQLPPEPGVPPNTPPQPGVAPKPALEPIPEEASQQLQEAPPFQADAEHSLEVKGGISEPVVAKPTPDAPPKADSSKARRASIATREKELSVEKQKLEAEKLEVEAGKQEVAAEKANLQAEREKLDAERQLIKDQQKLEADQRKLEKERLEKEQQKKEVQHIKDTAKHLKQQFSSLAKLDSNYSPYDEHGDAGTGSLRKKYFSKEVFDKFPALKDSHAAFQKEVQEKNLALHERTKEFMEAHPGNLTELEEVQSYKAHMLSYIKSQQEVGDHLKKHLITGEPTTMPIQNTFAEFVLWEAEKHKSSDLANVLSQRLADAGNLHHQLLAQERARKEEDKAKWEKESALRGGNEGEVLENYKRVFMSFPEPAVEPQEPEPEQVVPAPPLPSTPLPSEQQPT